MIATIEPGSKVYVGTEFIGETTGSATIEYHEVAQVGTGFKQFAVPQTVTIIARSARRTMAEIQGPPEPYVPNRKERRRSAALARRSVRRG